MKKDELKEVQRTALEDINNSLLISLGPVMSDFFTDSVAAENAIIPAKENLIRPLIKTKSMAARQYIKLIHPSDSARALLLLQENNIETEVFLSSDELFLTEEAEFFIRNHFEGKATDVQIENFVKENVEALSDIFYEVDESENNSYKQQLTATFFNDKAINTVKDFIEGTKVIGYFSKSSNINKFK